MSLLTRADVLAAFKITKLLDKAESTDFPSERDVCLRKAQLLSGKYRYGRLIRHPALTPPGGTTT